MALETRLVESLGCHVEVLYFELFDALAKYPVHLAHVDQFVVNIVDVAAACRSRIRIARIRFFVTADRLHIVQSLELSMLSITHRDISLHLVRQHVLQLRGISAQNPFNEL